MSPRASPVPEWVPDLPRAPGVYEFRDAHGTPLYVGKSVDLRRRVRGYFYGGGPSDTRMAQMLRLARAVAWVRTGSDLEAKLEEAERILRDRPPYNKALKNRSKGWYIELDWSRPFPRLRVVGAPRRARARYVGPFRGRALPSEMAKLTEKIFRLRSCSGAIRPDPGASPCLQYGIGLCTAPCAARVGVNGYRVQAREAARLLTEPDRAVEVRRWLEARRERAVAAGDEGAAVDWERRLAWLEEFEGYRRALERPWVERSWLLVLPGAERGTGVLVPVARGRVLPRLHVAWDGPWRAAVRDACYRVRIEELRAGHAFPAEALAPALLVSGWLEAGAPDGRALDLDRLDTAGVVSELEPAAA